MSQVKSVAKRASRIQRRLAAYLRSPGRIEAHSDVIFGTGIKVGRGRHLTIGERSFIGNDLRCMSNATIGEDVMISSQVAFIGDDHPFDNPNMSLMEETPNPPGHVLIEGNTLIGFGSIIIGSVIVERGAIVAAGSLVTGDLAPDTVYAGRPARAIRRRYAT